MSLFAKRTRTVAGSNSRASRSSLNQWIHGRSPLLGLPVDLMSHSWGYLDLMALRWLYATSRAWRSFTVDHLRLSSALYCDSRGLSDEEYKTVVPAMLALVPVAQRLELLRFQFLARPDRPLDGCSPLPVLINIIHRNRSTLQYLHIPHCETAEIFYAAALCPRLKFIWTNRVESFSRQVGNAMVCPSPHRSSYSTPLLHRHYGLSLSFIATLYCSGATVYFHRS
jgi:hypothetical protein